MIDASTLSKAAALLRTAVQTGQFIATLRATFLGLSADDAYAILNVQKFYSSQG